MLVTPSPIRLALLAAVTALGLSLLPGCDKEDTFQDAAPVTKLSQFDGGIKKKFDKKKDGKEEDLSEDALRNKALEAIKKNQERIVKSMEEANKQGDSSKKKNDSAKKNDNDPNSPRTFAGAGNSPIAEFPKKFPKGQNSISIPNNQKTNKLVEIAAPNQKGVSMNGDSATITNPNAKNRKDSANSDARVMSGNGSIDSGDAAKKDDKPGFLDKLPFFKKDKPDEKVIKTAEKGSQFELLPPSGKSKKGDRSFTEKGDGTAFGASTPPTKDELKQRSVSASSQGNQDISRFKPSAPDRHGLLSDQIRAEMAQNALEHQVAKKARKEEEKSDAVVVPLDGKSSVAKKHPVTDFDPAPNPKVSSSAPTSSAAPNTPNTLNSPAAAPTTRVENFADASLLSAGAAAKSAANPDDSKAPPATDSAKAEDAIQRQFGSLEDYQRGLKSADFVLRERAFQRAKVEKREDAIPALVHEITAGGSLCEFAAGALVTIGKRSDAVDRALVGGLLTTSKRDVNLRESCAVALGQLRVESGVPALMEVCKRDQSFPVRSACAAALGIIGDRSAITTLHMKLDDRGEIELVKQSAALALARFGDPAGRDHLINALDSQIPALQVLGITGLAQLNDIDTPGLLISRLNSELDEVWPTVIQLLPRLGAPLAVPALRAQLLTGNDTMRLRAGLALGYFGNADGIPYICRAARSGSLQERVMGCELLGNLGRIDQVPLLIEKLSDPHSDVRQVAAISLTRMKAADAIPALAEAARGRLQNQQLPPALRGAQSDMSERVVMLACLRILRGEKEDLALYTLPNNRDQSWPEFERELLKQQVEMIKLYKLVDVIPSGSSGVGALIQIPGGQEVLYRVGETVAAGFKIVDVNLGGKNKESGAVVPPFASLQRGNNILTLYIGQNSEASLIDK